MLEGIMQKILYPDGEEFSEERDSQEDYNVYFEPPSNISMSYPCIRYQRSKYDSNFADNIPYIFNEKYEITAIYIDPDSELPKRIAELQSCSHDRHYTANNLSHDVYTITL